MPTILSVLRDLGVIMLVLIPLGGIYTTVLWFSIKNTILEEERAEIARLFEQTKKKIVTAAVIAVVVMVFLNVVTDRLNRGIWTLSGIAWTLLCITGAAIVVYVLLFLYSVNEENTAQGRRI